MSRPHKPKSSLDKFLDALDVEKQAKKVVRRAKSSARKAVRKQVRRTKTKAKKAARRAVSNAATAIYDRMRAKPHAIVKGMLDNGWTREQIQQRTGMKKGTLENVIRNRGKRPGKGYIKQLREARRNGDHRKPPPKNVKPVVSARVAGAGQIRNPKNGKTVTIVVYPSTTREWIERAQREAARTGKFVTIRHQDDPKARKSAKAQPAPPAAAEEPARPAPGTAAPLPRRGEDTPPPPRVLRDIEADEEDDYEAEADAEEFDDGTGDTAGGGSGPIVKGIAPYGEIRHLGHKYAASYGNTATSFTFR